MRFKPVTAALCAAVLTITASGMVYAETDTSQGAVELMSEKVYIENPLGRWYFEDVFRNNQYMNCWLNSNLADSGSDGPGEGGASWWTGNDTLMLGGQRSKVWMNFGEPVSGGENFIVECDIKQTGGAQFVLGLTGDKVLSGGTTYTTIRDGLGTRLTGALVGSDGAVLKTNTLSEEGLNQSWTGSTGRAVPVPDDGDWHHYKIYCEADPADTLYQKVTLEVDGNVYNAISSNGTDTDGNWTGVFFMNNSTSAVNTALAEFKNIKVYAPAEFIVPPTTGEVSEKIYIENPLGRWSFGDVAGNNQYLNCWLNTDSGSGGNGPGEGGASWWTGNDTLMLGGQRSKVWMNFDEPVSGGENFIVECDIKQTGGAQFVLGLTGDKVLSGGTTYTTPGQDGLGARLTGALVGSDGTVLKTNTLSDEGLNQSWTGSMGREVPVPDDGDWHHYKIYCEADPADTLYQKVTLEVDGNVYNAISSNGTDTDGNWTGVFFMNNSTNAVNTALAEFKNIKVYAPAEFIVPSATRGISNVEFIDSINGVTQSGNFDAVSADTDMIRVTFSKPLTDYEISSENFVIIDADGQETGFKTVEREGEDVVVLEPASAFEPDMTYTLCFRGIDGLSDGYIAFSTKKYEAGQTDSTLFFDDFENAQIIHDAEGNVSLDGYSGSFAPVDGVDPIALADTADGHGKALSLYSTEGRVSLSTLFKSPIQGGKFGIEFDYLAPAGNFSLDILPTKQTWNGQFRVYFVNSQGNVYMSATPNVWPDGSNSVFTAINSKAWQHISMIVDCDAKTITYTRTYAGTSETTVKTFNYDSNEYWEGGNIAGFNIGTLLTQSNGESLMLDNFRVWIPPVSASDCMIEDWDGTLNGLRDVPATSVAAQIMFSGELNPSSINGAVNLINKSTGEETTLDNITLLADGKTIRAEFPSTLLDENTDYRITVDKKIRDIKGYNIERESIYEFNTKNGGFRIADFKAERDGQSVKVSASSILTDGSTHKVILALTTEQGNKLTSIEKKVIDLNTNGKTDIEIEYTLPEGVSFDQVYGYIWDYDTLTPIERCVSAESRKELDE